MKLQIRHPQALAGGHFPPGRRRTHRDRRIQTRHTRNSFGWWPVLAPLALALALLGPAALAQVTVTVDVTGDPVPGGTVTATATVDIMDGSTLQSIAWTQHEGAAAAIAGSGMTVDVTLGDLGAYREHLFHLLAEPPVEAEDLPPNVPLPEGEFPGGLQDRFGVAGVNPFALEEAAVVELEVEVVTTSGTYHGDGEIHTHLPWQPTVGIRTVPLGVPVLLQGKDQDSYAWNFKAPGASRATLAGADTRFPEFTPDFPGRYKVSIIDGTNGMMVTFEVLADLWRGVIVGQDGDGRPISDPACLSCHAFPDVAPDMFTPWAQTGHAEIFTNNLNTSTHYGDRCFGCHGVGFDPGVANNGMDDTPDYQEFMDSGLINDPGDNWTTVLEEFPATARLANIQCENCHGPQTSWSHKRGELRVDISSDVCAVCHGEPLRHARFQQWQLSGHADYELAIDESGSGNCSRCHTGNGFLKWLPVLLDDDPATDPLASIQVAWTADEAHPQTCVVCHDPHAIGTTTGASTDATVRIDGDTPPLIAGFTATEVGRGAICLTCHNTRRGLRNDALFDNFYGTSEAARAPHGGAQADILMGQNAYFVEVGNRGDHSMTMYVEDTCVTCHMEATPPPDILAYNGGGTNHTFFARNDICGECHGFSDGGFLQTGVQDVLVQLQGLIEDEMLDLITAQIAAGNTIDLNGTIIASAATIADIEFGEARGRQAITVTFTDATVVGPVRMNDVEVVPPAGGAFDLYNVADPSLIKAGWNYNLVNNDGSLGVHNPSFVGDLLNGAIAAL